MKHLYGDFSPTQIREVKKSIRGSIFFLLLCVDPKTASEYPNIDVNQCFDGLMQKLGGLNSLLLCPPELVISMSLLQSALDTYNNPDFNFRTYRKLILDAGAEIQKIKEV